MSADRFVISWLYQEFKVVHYKNETTLGEWTCPYPVEDVDALIVVLTEAWVDLDIKTGGDAYFIFEDDIYSHEYLETPDLSNKDLLKYLQRKVHASHTVEGEASIRFTKAQHNANSSGVLMHVIPNNFVLSLVEICENFNIFPKRLVSISDIISYRVEHIHQPQSVSLHIALLHQAVQLLLVREDGSILFVRELSIDWRDENNTTRFFNEIKRTLGYSKQRVQQNINELYFYGEPIDGFFEEFNGQVKFITFVDGTADRLPDHNYFWAQCTLHIAPKLTHNIISNYAKKSLTVKNIIKSGLVFGCACSLSLLSGVAVIEMWKAERGYNTQTLKSDLADIVKEKKEVKAQLEELERSRQRLAHLNTTRDNLPAVFYSYLGNILPYDATLLEASVIPSTNGWEITLSGSSELNLIEMPSVLTRLETSLSGEPWNMSVTHSWEESWMKQLKSGGAANTTAFGFYLSGQLQ